MFGNNLRNYLERRRVRKVFSKVADPETVDSLLNEEVPRRPLESGPIEFVFVMVKGESAEQVSERIGKVMEIAVAHGATIFDTMGPLVTVAFGTAKASPAQSGSRLSLIDDLKKQLTSDIKIVHGTAEGHFGLFGSKNNFSYSFLLPKFDAMLGALCRLQFGEIEEFSQ